MVYTILKQTHSLCRERAGHRIFHEEPEVNSSPGFVRIELRGTVFIQTPTSDNEYLLMMGTAGTMGGALR